MNCVVFLSVFWSKSYGYKVCKILSCFLFNILCPREIYANLTLRLSLMVLVSLGLSLGPSWDTLWANAYTLGLY
ncbi:hypothetical protein L1887_12589 [Cichorium endivia]|nr:hypothetical protein L1887_12589 [Cichorium endivia]